MQQQIFSCFEATVFRCATKEAMPLLDGVGAWPRAHTTKCQQKQQQPAKQMKVMLGRGNFFLTALFKGSLQIARARAYIYTHTRTLTNIGLKGLCIACESDAYYEAHHTPLCGGLSSMEKALSPLSPTTWPAHGLPFCSLCLCCFRGSTFKTLEMCV